MLAVCIQHEMDHLEGKLFVDYLSELKRERLKKKAAKKAKRAATRHRGARRSQIRARHLTRRRALLRCIGCTAVSHARIAFAGTPRVRRPGAAALVADRRARCRSCSRSPIARGPRSTPDGVAGERARAQSLVCRSRSPSRLTRAGLLAELGRAARLLVVIAYGLLLPQRCSSGRALGCINLHASLLPRWRGAAPIQRADSRGRRENGNQRHANGFGARHGPRVPHARDADRRAAKPRARCTIGSPCSRAARCSRRCRACSRGTRARRTAARRARNARAEDREGRGAARLARARAALERRVRAFDPWPVAETRLSDGRRLRVLARRGARAAGRPPAGRDDPRGRARRHRRRDGRRRAAARAESSRRPDASWTPRPISRRIRSSGADFVA